MVAVAALDRQLIQQIEMGQMVVLVVVAHASQEAALVGLEILQQLHHHKEVLEEVARKRLLNMVQVEVVEQVQ
jgi:NADH:ubiquinone oxidoreductase subunit K